MESASHIAACSHTRPACWPRMLAAERAVMRGFLIYLSGARPDILARCPTETPKFLGIGGAVLITSLLAFISMMFALVSVMGANVMTTSVFSLMWALCVLHLDRWMVTSLSPRGPGRFMVVLPRVLMSLLMSILISTPLVLQIFKPEIDAQIVAIQKQRTEEFQRNLTEGRLGSEIARLAEVVRVLRNVINSGGEKGIDPDVDPRMKTLQAARIKAQQDADKFYDEWQCQLYGGEQCEVRGDGALARKAQESYDSARRRLDALTRQIDDRKKFLTASGEQANQARLKEATDDLRGYQDQLDRRLEQREALRENFNAENHNSGGLLLRLQALNEVSARDSTVYAAMVLLFLFLTLIECLPVAVKLMQRPGLYERLLAEHEYAVLLELEARIAALDHDGARVTLEEVWEREEHEPDQAVVTRPPTDEDRQAQQDRELRTMRDARPPTGPRPAEGGDG
ncbi:DUF4407 domain-containing protein [Nonomuraea sp. NPDC004580]|uniref:DUF4407 domain-containing protein n=1 Tax=Nonomuraea sp. NPDC004580 TaxID=3154552 RepID=UPI0033A6AFCB